MSSTTFEQVLIILPATIASIAALVTAFGTWRKVAEVHTIVNSRVEALIETARNEGFLAGKLSGIEELKRK
jgi:galactokinase/mevalonate kinase-like predicted kinase